MCISLKHFLLVLILEKYLISTIFVFCFNVNFRPKYDVEVEPFNTQIYKRELLQFFDKASYSFNGFAKVESIPVRFPIDICILNLENNKYATTLYRRDNVLHFAVFKMKNGTYSTLVNLPTPKAVAMDCKGVGAKGYIAIAFNFSTPVENAREGSPIYELSEDRLRAVQYFAAANLVNVYLRVQGNDVMLLQILKNTKSSPNLFCPYFKWFGSTFNRVGRIPCSNARHLEPFSIDYEDFVAVANYEDQRGRTSTYSEIYKYIREKKKFQLFQKIRTNGAVDVRYFSVPVDEVRRQHFLIYGNSMASGSNQTINSKIKNLEADSVFYVFDKGQFVPYQQLTFYAVEQFLPVQNVDAEKFLLLVACTNQDIRIYNLNDWKFEESKAQFTEGALSKGVSRMRTYQDKDISYLVIANERMADNETNIFQPIFQQEEHANALRQEIIEWAKVKFEQLKRMDIEQLKRDVEKKLETQTQSNLPPNIFSKNKQPAFIKKVYTESLTYPKLHINSNYWKALSFASRALDALEQQHLPRHHRKREANIKPIRTPNESIYDFERINVNTLLVRDKINAKQVNGIMNGTPNFESITAKQIIVTGKYLAPEARSNDGDLDFNLTEVNALNVDNLITNAKLNGYHWHELLNNTLKRDGLQFLKEPVKLELLKTKKLSVTSHMVSEHNLANLVTIDGGNFVVDQHILFLMPVHAKKVSIDARINHVNIVRKEFDALLTKANKTQIVSGQKTIKNLRVLEPITVTGSILSSQLRTVLPNKAIHENIMLHGDYIIDGDVSIIKSLVSGDIIDKKSNLSANSILSNGIRFDTVWKDVNMNFTKPVTANNSIISFINAEDMQHLVRTNIETPQVIEGMKVFKNGLRVKNGSSEVKLLNGIDIEDLESRLLLKNTKQTIKVPIHLGRVLAKGIKSTNLTLNNKNVNMFLTKSTDQHINGTLKINKLQTETFTVENLNTNCVIFKQSLEDIYQQKSKKHPQIEIFQQDQKLPNTIYVKSLKVNSTLNEKSVNELEKVLFQLNGNIKYVGNFKFNHPVNTTNLTFYGNFNGLSKEEFGKCWLQKSGNQIFTANQTVGDIEFQNGAALMGKLNGLMLEKWFENTFQINRAEYIANAIIENPVTMSRLFTTTLNKLHVPDDMLYRSSNYPQVLKADILIQENLIVNGKILNTSSLNNINLAMLNGFLKKSNFIDTLYMENAIFNNVPNYGTLNRVKLDNAMNDVWLANENVELTNYIEISNGNFDGLLDLEGPINGINMKYLQENYLSRGKQQIITTETVFTKKVTFVSDLKADSINILGDLIEIESDEKLNFNEFVGNSLKIGGHHEIYGNWTILEILIEGSANNVAVNNLNFATDVVLLNRENYVTAAKYLPTAIIENLKTIENSKINNIYISKWLRDAVYTNKNQTIQGKTILENANLGALNVVGHVNSEIFNAHHLMLCDQEQILKGKVILRNKFPEHQRILVNNIENLQTFAINGHEVKDFLENVLKKKSQEVEVKSYLTFEQPLTLKEYNNDPIQSKSKRELSNEKETSLQKWKNVEISLSKLNDALKYPEALLYNIELLQVLPINATKIIPLTMFLNDEIVNLIGIFNETQRSEMIYYYWNTEKMEFSPYESEHSWLPRDEITLEIIKLIFGATDYLTVKRPKHERPYDQNIISSDGFKEILHIKNGERKSYESLRLREEECFATYYPNFTSVEIYCLDLGLENPLLKLRKVEVIQKNTIQILSLSKVLIAFLTESQVEIFNTTEGLQLQQLIKFNGFGKEISVGQINDVIFLALTTNKVASTLLNGRIEIFSSKNGDFKLQQTIELQIEIRQSEFIFLEQSNDLLLQVITNSNQQPLLVYQFKGVMGFQLIFGKRTVLGTANQMQSLNLKSAEKHLTALFNSKNIIFLDFVLRKL